MIAPDVLRQIRRIQLRARRAVQSVLGGEYHSAFKGTGLSFEDVREYQPGDDIRRIDWNVTARAGRPFLKRFVEERELTILFAVDFSGSLEFGSTQTTKRTVAAELTAALAFAAIGNGDRVGLLGFTDRVERYVPPHRGVRHAVRLIRDVLCFKPEHAGTDLRTCLEEIARLFRRRAMVVVISDFHANGYEAAFRRVATRHDLIAVRILDPLERTFPRTGVILVQDPETGARTRIDSSLIKHALSEQVKTLASSTGSDLIDLDTRGGHFDELVTFLRKRARRRSR